MEIVLDQRINYNVTKHISQKCLCQFCDGASKYFSNFLFRVLNKIVASKIKHIWLVSKNHETCKWTGSRLQLEPKNLLQFSAYLLSTPFKKIFISENMLWNLVGVQGLIVLNFARSTKTATFFLSMSNINFGFLKQVFPMIVRDGGKSELQDCLKDAEKSPEIHWNLGKASRQRKIYEKNVKYFWKKLVKINGKSRIDN